MFITADPVGRRDAHPVDALEESRARGGAGSLTPEQAMAVLRNRLASLDRQIGDIMRSLEGSSKRIDEISAKLDALEDVRKTMVNRDDPNAQINPAEDVNGVQPPTTIEAHLKAVGVTLFELGLEGAETTFSVSALDDLRKQLEREVSSINSDTELTMIQYQTLVQQRSEAISLCTNTVKSLQDALEGVVRNIG